MLHNQVVLMQIRALLLWMFSCYQLRERLGVAIDRVACARTAKAKSILLKKFKKWNKITSITAKAIRIWMGFISIIETEIQEDGSWELLWECYKLIVDINTSPESFTVPGLRSTCRQWGQSSSPEEMLIGTMQQMQLITEIAVQSKQCTKQIKKAHELCL